MKSIFDSVSEDCSKIVTKTYSTSFSMATKMDVLNWNAKSSLDSLNLICKELHKGLDGISKTWSEVAINITSTF